MTESPTTLSMAFNRTKVVALAFSQALFVELERRREEFPAAALSHHRYSINVARTIVTYIVASIVSRFEHISHNGIELNQFNLPRSAKRSKALHCVTVELWKPKSSAICD